MFAVGLCIVRLLHCHTRPCVLIDCAQQSTCEKFWPPWPPPTLQQVEIKSTTNTNTQFTCTWLHAGSFSFADFQRFIYCLITVITSHNKLSCYMHKPALSYRRHSTPKRAAKHKIETHELCSAQNYRTLSESAFNLLLCCSSSLSFFYHRVAQHSHRRFAVEARIYAKPARLGALQTIARRWLQWETSFIFSPLDNSSDDN